MTEQPEPTRSGRSGQWIGALVGALVAVCVVSAVVRANRPDPSAPARDAQRACQDFVRERLKAPATAEFSELAALPSDGGFTVTGDVDAENSFGAALRSQFTCVVHDAGGRWQLVSLTGLD